MNSIPLDLQLLGIKTQKGGFSYRKEAPASRAAAASFRFKSVSSLELHPPFSHGSNNMGLNRKLWNERHQKLKLEITIFIEKDYLQLYDSLKLYAML